MALRALQGPTGGGAPVGGGGTSSPSTIPRWTGASTLGDSGLIDNGTAIYTTTRNFGIGTASPSAKLEIPSTVALAGIRVQLGAAPKNNYHNAEVHYFRNLSDLNRVAVDTVNNYLDVSFASGWGLKLPATPGNTDPNTLDAYVDGGTAGGGGKTWTPTDTSGAGLTLTVNSAQYVQVGKLVVMTADITYPVTASAAVAALSLPVSPAVNYFHAGSTGYQTTPAIAGLAPMVKNTAMNMWAYDTQQTNAQLSGKRLIFTVSYFMG